MAHCLICLVGLPRYIRFSPRLVVERFHNDTVPRELMLARLIDKGVTGRLFHAVDYLHANARSATRVDGAVSEPFPVHRGVAQGCPMSPFLYALFIDSLLDDLLALGVTEGLEVGAADWHRLLTGQAYADDLSGFASTPHGMQRVIDAVRTHSQRWGWAANVRKTVVAVFGHPTMCTQYANAEFWWGSERLQVSPNAKYLGLHLRSDMTWHDQHAAAAQKGRSAAAVYAPLLASDRLPVRLKLSVLSTRIEPTMTYALEVWEPTINRRPRAGTRLDPVDEVLHNARRLTVGIHASKHERAWERAASIKPAVLDSDCRALAAQVLCTMAQTCYCEVARQADCKAAAARQGDPLHATFEEELPVTAAVDYMGAATRSGLDADDAWQACATRGRDLALTHLPDKARARYTSDGTGSAAPRLPNHCIRAALLADAARPRQAQSCALPTHAAATRSGRQVRIPRPPPGHLGRNCPAATGCAAAIPRCAKGRGVPYHEPAVRTPSV